jgi:hypothetical protein
MLTGTFSEFFVRGKLVVQGNAAVTSANILAHQTLFRLGFASALICVVCYVVVTALFYKLFEPVSRSISLMAAFFSLLGCSVQAFICLYLLAPLVALEGAPYSKVFTTEQLQAMALTSMGLYGEGFGVAMVFFGFYCLLIGWLLLRSTFLPRILGGLMALSGLCWLTFLFPLPAGHLFPAIMGLGVLGEGSLTFWLLARGIKANQWTARASATGMGAP